LIRIVLISVVGITAGIALAQDTATQTPEEERSFFTSLLEDQLSTPNRIIRISGIQGVLSSEATIGQITIADRQGVWLRINNATIDWSRTTLLLRQRLEVSRLAAESIEVVRKPLPDENALPSPEATSFSVPELPIAVNLGALEVPSLSFGCSWSWPPHMAANGRSHQAGSQRPLWLTHLVIRSGTATNSDFYPAAETRCGRFRHRL